MSSVLGSAWRVLVKRLAADWLMLAAAAVTIVLATTLLAAGPIYAEAVSLAGLRRTLDDSPVAEANIEISLRARPAVLATVDEIVTGELRSVPSLQGAQLSRRIQAEPHELPVKMSGDIVDLGSIEYLEGLEEHASLVSGAFPADQETSWW